MARTTEYENPERLRIIKKLKQKAKTEHVAMYDKISEELSRVRKNRRAVNIRKINRFTKEGDIVVVPGKVMGDGFLDHKVEIAAFSFTSGAEEKIAQSESTALTIEDFVENWKPVSNIKFIG